jgi:pyruvate/2-oxoglutarate dehydrogenase complex dihydrolipoamide dehydrogenase (E3) component
MMTRFDAIVVGAGQAGPSLAARLAGVGMKVALVERRLLGGTCVNTGCTPTKAMVASAYAAHLTRRATDYGVRGVGRVSVDMKAVKARKDAIVEASRNSLSDWLCGTKNLTLMEGHARFASASELSVGDAHISAPRIFLDVGGRATVPDYPGTHDIGYLTNSTILDLEAVPEHLVVVGGGYVGLEFAQMFRRFGSEVTVVQRGPRLLPREDEDVSEAMLGMLRAEGIKFRLEAECISFARRGERKIVSLDCRQGEPEIAGSHVLLAIGRTPNTGDLGLDMAGVNVDERGIIEVDDELRTNVPGIWALGDCNGRGAFTHTSYNDYEIVAENLLDSAGRKVTDRHTAYALYTDPPLGRAGMGEADARRAGHSILVGKRPMTRVARAVEKGETIGFMKIVTDAESGKLLGAAILGVGGDEAVHSVLDLIHVGASAEALRRSVHIHPTVAELLPTLVAEQKSVLESLTG